MTIKRILIHIGPDEQRVRTRLEAGLILARTFDAALHGLFVIDPAVVPAQIEGRGASRVYVDETMTVMKQKAAALEDTFRRRCEQENVRGSWTSAEGETLAIMTAYSFCTDITLVGQQTSSGLDDVMSLHRTDYLPLRSPGPVLVMPHADERGFALDRITIAWKPTRACARALHDALPLLRQSRAVTILRVDPPDDWELPDDTIGDYLSAHGIKPSWETRSSDASDGIGDAILTAATEMQANLLVMGAHGQSRLRELIFGGATHDILQRMRLPVLMSH